MQEFVSSIEAEYDELVTSLNETLKGLETKYPKGEIDLKEGIVIFDDGQ
jgi:hypothetical protein